jgi:hypothetical protein
VSKPISSKPWTTKSNSFVRKFISVSRLVHMERYAKRPVSQKYSPSLTKNDITISKKREETLSYPKYTMHVNRQSTTHSKEEHIMKLFSKKEKIILRSEEQKEIFINKLENAHIDYDIREDRDSVFSNHPTYIIRIEAADMAKVI